MAVVADGTNITFTYLTDDLFNLVMMKTMYRAKHIKDDKGKSLIDDYGVSQDERGVVNEFVKTAANLVFRSVLKITKGVSGAIAIDVTETTGNIVLKILDNTAYNANVLTYVDTLIKETIIYKVISEWYKTCGIEAEYAKFENDYIKSTNELYDGLFELRKPLIS